MIELSIIMVFITGLFWGLSNFLVEKTSFDSTYYDNKEIFFLRKYIFTIIVNYKFFICYLTGQIGSILFYYCLGNDELKLSFIVVVSNAISIVAGFLCEIIYNYFDKEKNNRVDNIKKLNNTNILGVSLVLFGVYLVTC